MWDLGFIIFDVYEFVIDVLLIVKYNVMDVEVDVDYVVEMVCFEIFWCFGENVYIDGYIVIFIVESCKQVIVIQVLRDGLEVYDCCYGFCGVIGQIDVEIFVESKVLDLILNYLFVVQFLLVLVI